MDIKKYCSKIDKLKNDRANFESWWQDVSDYTLPRRDFTSKRSAGDRRNVQITDQTGLMATQMLASGLHGYLTPPNTRWATLRVPYVDVSEDGMEWLSLADDAIFDISAFPDSMFSTSMHEAYLDLVAYGNCVLMPKIKSGRVVLQYVPLSGFYFEENEIGQVNQGYNCLKLSAFDVIELFGDEAHEAVKKSADKNDGQMFEIFHCVHPRDYYKTGSGVGKKEKAFASVYIDKTNKHIMREDGYDTFPYIVGRFAKRSGEVYGYGAGMDALPEVRMLNKLLETSWRAAAKAADPPVLSPVDGIVMPYRIDPAGITFYNPDIGKPEFFQSNFQPAYLNDLIREKQALIMRLYYSDWLRLPERTQPFTATETIQRSQDGMRLLSPMLSRIEAELLSPMVQRILLLMIDNGILPKPPAELQGQEIRIEYISPMAQSQRATTSSYMMQGLNVALQLAQFDQSVLQNIDSDAIFRDQVLDTYNWRHEYLRTQKEVDAMREAAQEQQNAMMALEGAETASKAMKNIGGAMQ